MSKLFTLFALFILLSSVNPARASHLISGELYYEYLGSDNYLIHLTLYRDCNGTGAQFENPLALGVFDTQSNSLLQTVMITNNMQPAYIPYMLPCDSLSIGLNSCREAKTYDTVLYLPPTSGGYTITYQRCCFNNNIINILDSGDYGFTLTTKINGIASTAQINSSPHFTNDSPFLLCLNDSVTIDHSAIDLDEDVLSYSIDSCWQGGHVFSPLPVPPFAPPYQYFTWETGFSNSSPLGSSSTVSIDSLGNITFIPQNTGDYLIAVRIEESRNGVVIGETRRFFVVRVVNPLTSYIAEQNQGNIIDVFPNPLHDFCTLTNATNAILTITNSAGKVILSQKIKSNNAVFDMEQYDPGLYFFRIDFEGDQVVRKISKL